MVRIGIIGARGFAGGELLRLCLQHPGFEITYVTSESQAGAQVWEAFPGLTGATDLRFAAYDTAAAVSSADAFFFALPDGEAMLQVGALLAHGKRIVDVSGDFRVSDPAVYRVWYGREHATPELLSRAVYGLPEIGREVADARLVANPGCYPTAALLAVAPLFAAGLAEPEGLVVDAKSGVSGAGGRSALDPAFSYAAIDENFRAYSPTRHRHIAEMEQELARLCGKPVTLCFVPHLLPLMRGILATCYVPLAGDAGEGELEGLLREYYAGAPFIHVLSGRLPETRHVAGSNRCHLAVRVEPRTHRAIIVSAIDNLVKGAAGSAIQNMNLACGLAQDCGLRQGAFGP